MSLSVPLTANSRDGVAALAPQVERLIKDENGDTDGACNDKGRGSAMFLSHLDAFAATSAWTTRLVRWPVAVAPSVDADQVLFYSKGVTCSPNCAIKNYMYSV